MCQVLSNGIHIVQNGRYIGGSLQNPMKGVGRETTPNSSQTRLPVRLLRLINTARTSKITFLSPPFVRQGNSKYHP